jgi:hypothetical protein
VEPKDFAGYVLPHNIYIVDWQVGSQSKYPTCETWWRREEISEALPLQLKGNKWGAYICSWWPRHPQIIEIHEKLKRLWSGWMYDEGYAPHTICATGWEGRTRPIISFIPQWQSYSHI